MTPRCDLAEAKTALVELSLTAVMYGDYLVVMNSDFDVTIAEEPYLALMLLFNVGSGKFMARIWNQTVRVGEAGNLEEFVDACKSHFGQGRPCIGCPQEDTEPGTQGCLISQTPIPRKISVSCQRVLGKDASVDLQSCQECHKLSAESTTVCKVEIKENEEEDWPEFKYDCDDGRDLTDQDGQTISATGHKCPWCEEVFSSNGTLTYHKKTRVVIQFINVNLFQNKKYSQEF